MVGHVFACHFPQLFPNPKVCCHHPAGFRLMAVFRCTNATQHVTVSMWIPLVSTDGSLTVYRRDTACDGEHVAIFVCAALPVRCGTFQS